MTRDSSLAPSLAASTLIHLAALVVASALIGQRNHFREQNLISIALLSPTRENKTIRPQMEHATKPESPKQPPARLKHEPPRAESTTPTTAKNEMSKPEESKIAPTTARVPRETALAEGGGSASGGDIIGGGDIGVLPGSGTGSGGGIAVAGLGRGASTPGLPGQQSVLKTNREARPIQTARASYPPMALRMGMESDVTLRIEVDAEGKVVKAEIIKSGGAGFDEEALKAVKQSRFEPAQRDGQNVAAEFTYIYRFRLQK